MRVWLWGPAFSGNPSPPPGASPHCSQRGKTPLYCLQSSRFPLILIGLGRHTFQSRNGEAGALNSLGALTHGSWRVPVKTVASAIFLHLLPCCPPHPTARDTVNTRRLPSIAKSLPTSQLLSSVPLVSKPARTGLNVGCSNRDLPHCFTD